MNTMKPIRNLFGTAVLTAAALFISSCSGEHEHASDALSDSTAHEHEHTFACPMHPEVTGHEGEACPKCGMKLVHNDNAGNTNTYIMQFTAAPALPKAGEEVTLSFTPKIKGDETVQVPLDVEHEKKIHLIIVSNDLSWFDHVHPEYNADGSYTVKAVFPAGGGYTLFADYVPTGGVHQLEKIPFTVSGTPAANIPLTTQRLSGNAGGYEVTISNESAFVTNNLLHMGAVIRKDGKEVPADELGNYLGAKAHVVIIGLDSKEYLHVHPEVVNGKFDLHTTFEKAGLYKGWFQFRTGEQVHTVDFVLDVKEGKAGDVQGHDAHGADEHDHTH
jgi:hypothetical protein